MEPKKQNYDRKGVMRDELSDTESKTENASASLIDANDEDEKIIGTEIFSGNEELADGKSDMLTQVKMNAKSNQNIYRNEENIPTNTNQIENYEGKRKLDSENHLMKNEDVFVKVGASRNDASHSKADLVCAPEQENVLCKRDNFKEVAMAKPVAEEKVSLREEPLEDELYFSNEGIENADVSKRETEVGEECSFGQSSENQKLKDILANVENEEITVADDLDENGKEMIVNDCISKTEKEANDGEDSFAKNDGMRKICNNQGTEEVSHNIMHCRFDDNEKELSANESRLQTGEGDDNAGNDEENRMDDNLIQKDDIIITDDKFDHNEKELYESENNSEAREKVDEKQNFTETDEDRRVWESLPKREDEIVKDDNFHQNGNKSRSAIGDKVSDMPDSFTGENEERRMHDNLPKGKDKESRSLKMEDVSDVQNVDSEKNEDLRLCGNFFESADGDDFDHSGQDLNVSKRNLPSEKEVDCKEDNFTGGRQEKSDEIESKDNVIQRSDGFEHNGKDMNIEKSTSREKKMYDEQDVFSGIEDTRDHLGKNKFRRSSGDGRIDQNLADLNVIESRSQFQKDGEDNFVKKCDTFETSGNVYEKGEEAVTNDVLQQNEKDINSGERSCGTLGNVSVEENGFSENYIEIETGDDLSKGHGDEGIRGGLDNKNKEKLNSTKSNSEENEEGYCGINTVENEKSVPCDVFFENEEFNDNHNSSRNGEQDVEHEDVFLDKKNGFECEQKSRNNREDASSERASRSEGGRELHDGVKSEKDEIEAKECRPKIESCDVEGEEISEGEKHFSEHQNDFENQTGIIKGEKLSGREEQGEVTENCFIKEKGTSEVEDSSKSEEVDIDSFSEREKKRITDVAFGKEKVKFAYNATSENDSDILKLYWVPYKNGRKDTEKKAAAEKKEDIKKDNFSNLERKQEGVRRKDSRRKIESEIHDINQNDKHTDNRNYLLPDKRKVLFKSSSSLPVEDWEMASVEEYASGELELSTDLLEAGCSGIRPKRKTEIAPVEIEDFRISNGTSDEEEEGLVDEEGEVEEEEEDTYDFQFKCEFCTTFMAFFSVVGYVGDLVSDLVVSYFWFRDGHPLWGGLSLFFALFPTLILNWMSFGEMKSQRSMKRSLLGIEQKPWVWRVTVASHFILLGPFIRYSKHFLYMFPLRKKVIKLKNTTLQEMAVYSVLLKLETISLSNMALTEGFMESAPQLILQIYTMSLITDDTKSKARVIAQVASMLFSLFKLSWSVTNFHTTKRLFPKDNKFGTVFNFLWQVNTFASRVLSVALFATIFPKSCLTVCCGHAVAASAWVAYHMHIKKNKTPLSVFTIKKLGPVLSVLVIGVIHVFCYPEHGVGPRRYRLLAYYLIVGVENAMFITLWFAYVDNPEQWLKILAFVAVYVCYVMGVVSLIIYYRFFHFNILEHPERWKMKILFPEKEDGDKKEEKESSNEDNVNEGFDNEDNLNEDSKNEDNLKADSGNEDSVNDSSIIYIDEDFNNEDNMDEDSMMIR